MNPVTKLCDAIAKFYWNKAAKAYAKSREASAAGDNDVSAHWYREYLKYSKLYNKYNR